MTVLVDEKTLAGIEAPLDDSTVVRETLYGSDVPQELLDLWACDCSVSRLVITANGVPLDLGREVRTANREQRRALKGRDRGCAVPGCDCSPNWCDAHHIVWWTRGGTTDLENLVMTCRHHHRRIHAGELLVKMIDGGYRASISPTAPKSSSAYAPPPRRSNCCGWSLLHTPGGSPSGLGAREFEHGPPERGRR